MAKARYDMDNTYLRDDEDTYERPPVPSGGQEGADPNPGTITSSPWDTPPADGDWRSWFLKNTQGTPPTPAQLLSLKDTLKKHGIDVLTNASGIAGKIKFPDGKIVDVIESAGTGGKAWQWLDGASSSGGDGWDWLDEQGPEAYQTLERPDYLKGEYKPPTWDGGDFKAPSADELYNDPGYASRLAASQKSFERGAAAKGSILSGGSQVALSRRQGELASQEYGNLFGRAYDTYQSKYGQFRDRLASDVGARGINENAYQSDVSNNLNQYGTRYKTWRDAIDDRFRLADYGFNATTAGRP